MSRPKDPNPAKIITGVFTKDKSFCGPVLRKLEKLCGPVDIISPWYPFNYTRYYESEMGMPLFRRMFAFKEMGRQEQLPELKLATNEIEREFSLGKRRRINIDPGYLLLERFVLATGKNFTHRIYIGKGIYADLTLIYQNGSFQSLPWTYPDYSAKEMRIFLSIVRDKYKRDLKRL